MLKPEEIKSASTELLKKELEQATRDITKAYFEAKIGVKKDTHTLKQFRAYRAQLMTQKKNTRK